MRWLNSLHVVTCGRVFWGDRSSMIRYTKSGDNHTWCRWHGDCCKIDARQYLHHFNFSGIHEGSDALEFLFVVGEEGSTPETLIKDMWEEDAWCLYPLSPGRRSPGYFQQVSMLRFSPSGEASAPVIERQKKKGVDESIIRWTSKWSKVISCCSTKMGKHLECPQSAENSRKSSKAGFFE